MLFFQAASAFSPDIIDTTFLGIYRADKEEKRGGIFLNNIQGQGIHFRVNFAIRGPKKCLKLPLKECNLLRPKDHLKIFKHNNVVIAGGGFYSY